MSKQWVQIAVVSILAAAVTASGVWIVWAEHQSRQLFIQTEALNREADQLEIDWGRLQIEQSTYAAHPRIEALARERLSLIAPRDEQLVVVVQSKTGAK